jgi:hypothetical protein
MERGVNPIGNYAFENLDLTDSLAQLFENDDHAKSHEHSFPQVETVEFQSISKLQLRKSLIYFEVLEQVEAAVAETSQETQDNWYSTKPIERDDKFLNEVAKKLHFTDRQIDFIFEMGVTL